MTTDNKPLSKEEKDLIEEKFKIIERCYSGLNSELRYDSDRIAVYTAFKAMDIYAKQESMEFLKWFVIKSITFIEYVKDIRPIVASNEIDEKLKEFEGKSLSELYTLYLQSKEK